MVCVLNYIKASTELKRHPKTEWPWERAQKPGQPAAQNTVHPALPEAPASANVHVQIGGRAVQLTLRDHDETRLLVRLAAILQCFLVEPAPVTAQSEGWCQKHGVEMRQSSKNGRTWFSHRLETGTWCKGK